MKKEIKKQGKIYQENSKKRYENEKSNIILNFTPVLLNKYCRLGKKRRLDSKDAFSEAGAFYVLITGY